MIDATLTQRMEEATRLTRAGKLSDAMALLQGLAPGETRQVPMPPFDRGNVYEGNVYKGTVYEGSCQQVNEGGQREPSADGPWPGQAAGRADTAKPGVFSSGRFSNRAGTREYKLYLPRDYHGQALPLVVMLHGCTQHPDDFATGTAMNRLAEEQSLCVLYPAQPTSANTSRCWNWFKTTDQQREGGEPEILAGMTRHVLDTHNLDASRVYVAGLSAGGAMATTLAMTYPDLFAAVGVHSGLPHGVAQSLPDALAAMQGGKPMPGRAHESFTSLVPAIIFHGDKDATVHVNNAERVAAQYGASSATGTVESGQVAGGHRYTCTRHGGQNGEVCLEQWRIHGAGHAWAGGSSAGSYTDPKGPDASRQMLRFFLKHRREARSA